MPAAKVVKRRKTKSRRIPTKIVGIDLFCGAGGLTHGLEAAGIKIALGVDIDPACEYPYSTNNKANFLLKSVEKLSSKDFEVSFDGRSLKLLAGCAPCQPFSTYSQGKSDPADKRWNLLKHFARLIKEVKPDIVTMENVPRLAKQNVFKRFVADLKEMGFHVSHSVINCADYGVPQQRSRLVLLASRLGEIAIVKPYRNKEKYRTVRDAIEDLPSIRAGGSCAKDPLHQSSDLSALNSMRIRASKSAGSWRDWDRCLVAKCHKKVTGKSYPGVYGRMSWDEPAPTMTTQYFGFGNGRFGHPKQNRAISLREGAILQSFPRKYKFVKRGEVIRIKTIGRLIGNAVPVKLGEAIGKSIVQHVRDCARQNGRGA